MLQRFNCIDVINCGGKYEVEKEYPIFVETRQIESIIPNQLSWGCDTLEFTTIRTNSGSTFHVRETPDELLEILNNDEEEGDA